MLCPKCHKDDHIHRSRRKNTTQRVISVVLLVRPYRCHHCNTRFWRPRFLKHKHSGSIQARGKRARTASRRDA